jgi:hypothetical protein
LGLQQSQSVRTRVKKTSPGFIVCRGIVSGDACGVQQQEAPVESHSHGSGLVKARKLDVLSNPSANDLQDVSSEELVGHVNALRFVV